MALAAVSAHAAEQVRLVKQFDWASNPPWGGCGLQPALPVGGLDFAVFSGRLGAMSWRTDGTAAGTYVLSDVCIGTCQGYPMPEVAVVGGAEYYVGGNQGDATVLWKTDGTVAGTGVAMLLDEPGQASSTLYVAALSGRVLILGQYLGNDGVWLSDGTPGGTTRLSSAGGAAVPLVVGNRAFFSAVNGGLGREPWVTDGTPAGTYPLKDICPNDCSSNPSGMVQAGGLVYFLANDGVQGTRLWRTDGTPDGTFRLRDDFPAGVLGYPYSVQPIGSKLVFFLGGDGQTSHLWSSDGTTAGTADIHDFPVPNVGWQGETGFAPGVFATNGRLLFFSADDGVHGPELWATDGTRDGTRLVRDITPGEYGTTIAFAASSPDAVLMVIDDGVHGRELWRSDGTSAGTSMVADICPGACSSDPGNVTVIGSTALFSAESNAPDRMLGRQLWKTDLVTGATELVADICPGGCSSLTWSGSPFLVLGGAAVFSAMSNDGYCRVWRSDGTAAGTFPLLDWAQGPPPRSTGWIDGMIDVNGQLLFTTIDPYVGPTTWRSDGTTYGTVPSEVQEPSRSWAVSGGRLFGLTDLGGDPAPSIVVTDVAAGTTQELAICQPGMASSWPTGFQPYHGGVLFQNYDPAHGAELWASDGTYDGTRMVADVLPGAVGSRPGDFARTRDAVLFSAATGSGFRDLWRSDGTPEGTTLVAPGVDPTRLAGAGDRVFFAACHPSCSLMVSDGTLAGTRALPGSGPSNMVAFDGGVLFDAVSNSGDELWRSDGTQAGTSMVKDIWPGQGSSYPTGITAAGAEAFFAAASPPGDVELWKTDGTAAGTALVKDIAPGLLSSDPTSLVAAGGVVYFVASDGQHGAEVWRSDGTAAGTGMVADLCPGACSSTPTALTRVGSTVFFAADDWQHGMALWALDLGLVEVSAMDAAVGPGEVQATVPIVLSGKPDREVTLGFETEDGTAYAGSDYVRASGTLTIAAGSETAAPIVVPVTARSAGEPEKWFFVNLTERSGGTVRRGTARVTLTDGSDLRRVRRHLWAAP